MNKKLFVSVLVGLSLLSASALAALPKEGVYEKHSKDGKLEARMHVMGAHGDTKYNFGYGNESAEIIWVESYMPNGEKHAEFATKYIWKRDDVGAAETALILDRQGLENLKNGKVAAGFTGKFNYIADNLDFTPLSMAYVIESTSNQDRLLKAEQVNQEGNQSKLRIKKVGQRYEFVENMLEQGLLVKLDASLGSKVDMRGWYGRGVLLGSAVRLRANTTTKAKIIGMLDLDENVEVKGYEKGLDGRGWYYVKKDNGLEGFAAAQFIELR